MVGRKASPATARTTQPLSQAGLPLPPLLMKAKSPSSVGSAAARAEGQGSSAPGLRSAFDEDLPGFPELGEHVLALLVGAPARMLAGLR